MPAVAAWHVPGDGVDAFGTDWFYWWIRTCLAHGGDPSFTPLFFHPDGKDIFAHTGNNFVDAVLAAPFFVAFGPILGLSAFYILIQLANAATFRPLAVEILGPTPAASLATLLWQVNPYVLFELGAGRPTQACLWFVPAAVLYFLRCARDPSPRNAAWLGLAVAMTGWTYWYNGYFVAFFLLTLAPWSLGASPRRTVVAWAVAAVVALVLILPAAVPMWGAVASGGVPGTGSDSPQAIANNVEAELHGLWLVETRGERLFTQPAWCLPIFLAFLPGVRDRWRWMAALVVLLVLGLGAGLRVGDTVIGHPVYLFLYDHLPFFDRLWFPYRIAGVAFLPATFLVVRVWERFGSRPILGAVLLVGGLAGQGGVWPLRHHDPRPPEILSEITRQPGGVIFTPMRIQHSGLSWQTFFARPTFGGMGESAAVFWPEGYRRRLKNPFVRALADAAARPAKVAPHGPDDRAAIEELGFRWVVMRRDLVAQLADQESDRTHMDIDPDQRDLDAIAATSRVVGAGPVASDPLVVIWALW